MLFSSKGKPPIKYRYTVVFTFYKSGFLNYGCVDLSIDTKLVNTKDLSRVAGIIMRDYFKGDPSVTNIIPTNWQLQDAKRIKPEGSWLERAVSADWFEGFFVGFVIAGVATACVIKFL